MSTLRRSIGMATKGGKFASLVTRGTALPASRTEIFTTADPAQATIVITLLAGDHRKADRNAWLARYVVCGFDPAPPGMLQIAVTIAVGLDEAVQVTARNAATGEDLDVISTMVTG